MSSSARLLLAGASSNSGKTLITCGLLSLLKKKGLDLQSFKCGPDYIDPLFHEEVLGIPSGNLDTFFSSDDTVRYLLERDREERDMALIEGVMGYYDGIGGISLKGSTYDIARATKTPVVLILSAKGMSLSMVAMLKGYLTYVEDHRIEGIILNNVSEKTYTLLKPVIEEELFVPVLGYVPYLVDAVFESRHLGLILPFEKEKTREKIEEVGEVLAATVDIEKLCEIASKAIPLAYRVPELRKHKRVRIGVSKDEAFCFCYKDNLRILEDMGAALEFFSPLHDQELPEVDGLLLMGGYPELYAKELEENESMRASIHKRLSEGIPCLAECGGFMYLQEAIKDEGDVCHSMVGFLEGHSYKGDRLGHFGYITLTTEEEQMLLSNDAIKGHEFHYYKSHEEGAGFKAEKPLTGVTWPCIKSSPSLVAGFPHLYYHSNPAAVGRFLDTCWEYREKRGARK